MGVPDPVTCQDFGRLPSKTLCERWYNPRNEQATAIGTFANKGEQEFTPPDKGEMVDWVLVLDDAAKQYPAPGSRE